MVLYAVKDEPSFEQCFAMKPEYRNPLVTVDIIIEMNGDIVMIERAAPPYGWALPGGFVDYGESLEASAVREAKEETSLNITLLEQFHTYSDPDRDPRHHTITTVYIASGDGTPRATDDAKNIGTFNAKNLPSPIAFDHKKKSRIIFDTKKRENS